MNEETAEARGDKSARRWCAKTLLSFPISQAEQARLRRCINVIARLYTFKLMFLLQRIQLKRT
jgi:hypothetical protein